MHFLVLANDANSWVWWSWIPDHQHEIYAYLREHMTLTVLSVFYGFLIALPLAVFAARRRAIAAIVVPVVNAIYTVPSVALLALLLPITGTGRTPAVIALTLYSLAILVRNIMEGLRGVPADVLDAADGMGYTRRRRLVRVELPLALPAIVAGIRLATVSTIGLVTVTFIVDQGGLGRFIQDGYQRDFHTPLVVGIVLSVALAVVADLLLVRVERAVTPWQRTARRGR
ncbi:MAG TPA: ABC transporter permease [Acidimicrobiia bacterium]|nr:ABC transporter permease [Acidimicrobiia bacterium]